MKTIKLNSKWSTAQKGFEVIVDDEDYERVSKYYWTLAKRGKHYYAKNHSIGYLHRLILNPPRTKLIDHINCNGLDNRKENLRLCNHSQNKCNRERNFQNKSGYKGVYRSDTKEVKWNARISFGNIKSKHIGIFKTKKEAALAYNEAAKRYHGEYAKLNEI